MPKAFDELVKKIRSNLKGKTNPRTKKPYTDSDIYAIATSQWKKTHSGKAPSRSSFTPTLHENIRLDYAMPVQFVERFTNNKGEQGVKINGVALKYKASRNGNLYTAEECNVKSLIGRNISMGHSPMMGTGNPVDNVGVIYNAFDKDEGIMYEGTVYNTAKYPDVTDMIEKGLIPHVSIEANARELEEMKMDGQLIKKAKGVEFLKLAFVDIPGFPETSVGMAEAYDKALKDTKLHKEENFMIEEETKPEEETVEEEPAAEEAEETTEETPTEEAEKPAEEPKAEAPRPPNESSTALLTELKKTNDLLRKSLSKPVEKKTKVIAEKTEEKAVKTVKEGKDVYKTFPEGYFKNTKKFGGYFD